jgi:DNA polymerase-3 subunit epsilon
MNALESGPGAEPGRTAGKAPLPSLEEAVFTAFDVETTGLIAGVDRIVEIGAVSFRRDRVIGRFESLVAPGMRISPDAQRINGISEEMLAGKPGIEEVLPDFFRFLGLSYPVAHNAPFDVGFVFAASVLHGVTAPDMPVFDTRALAETAFPRRGSYSLRALSSAFSIGSGTSHRALADADACRELFLLCLDRLTDRGPSGRGIADLDGIKRLSGVPLSMVSNPPADIARISELSGFLKAGESVEILYVSGTGEETVRRITPLSFCTLGGSPAVEAFCHLRREKRTFRVSSIKRVTPAP